MSAARQRRGKIATTERKIWRARTLSAAVSAVNGPRPWVPAQIATSEVRQERQARSARSESHGGPQEEGQQEHQGRVWRSGECRRDPTPLEAKATTATARRERREKTGLGAPAKGRLPEPATMEGCDRQDRRHQRELGQQIREEAGVPDGTK